MGKVILGEQGLGRHSSLEAPLCREMARAESTGGRRPPPRLELCSLKWDSEATIPADLLLLCAPIDL